MSADHAGYELKEQVKEFLIELKSSQDYRYEVIDYGAYQENRDDNYTDIMHSMAYNLSLKLKEKEHDIAFVFGGSGEGEGMLMNRYSGIRAITYYGGDINIIRLGREHNNANCISFGARFVDLQNAKQAILIFLNTDFEGGRHLKRVRDIDKRKLKM